MRLPPNQIRRSLEIRRSHQIRRWVSAGITGVAPLAHAVIPRDCVGCGAPGNDLCARCGAPLALPARLSYPVPCPAGLPPTYAVADNEGAVREALVRLKEDGRRGLCGPLSGALAAAVAGVLLARAVDLQTGVHLLPMPSSPDAVRTRGTRAVADLASAAAATLRTTGLSAACWEGLSLARSRGDQTTLSATARARNVAGTVTSKEPPTGALVLVDDIVTTGASLAEAARALRQAGGEPVGCAVVAATRRHAHITRIPGANG